MSINIAINGFGRIGRAAFKIALENKNVNVVAINDLMDNATLAHLLQYDTVYGKYDKKVEATADGFKVAGRFFPILEIKEPENLPWKKLKVDVVLECTGIFRKAEDAKKHLAAGAKVVLLSAPGKGDDFQTLVLGTSFTEKNVGKSDMVSNASCTTNCISPVIQVLQDAFGIEKALMTTIHGYTADQNLVDGPHKDLRRARAAAQNIIPTSTGAAKATTKVIPELAEKFDGVAIRVPVICGSVSDITVLLKKEATVKEVNQAFIQAVSKPQYQGVLDASQEPLVSSDIIKNTHSAIVDLELTQVVGGNLVKVFAWYDNEWGYSNRLIEMAESLAKAKAK